MVRRQAKLCFSFIFIFVFLLFAEKPAFYLKEEIASAIQRRALSFQHMGAPQSLQSLVKDKNGLAELQKRVESTQDNSNHWYYFLKGIAVSVHSPNDAASFFQKSLSLSRENIGDLFLLSVEFDKLNQFAWANEAIKNLDRLLCLNGASSAPLISYNLLLREEQRRKSGAAFGRQTAPLDYLQWSSAVDRHQVAAGLYRIVHNDPPSAVRMVAEFHRCISGLLNDWQIQLNALNHFYLWFRSVCIAFIFIILLLISVEKLPAALHGFVDRYPLAVPAALRTGLVVAVFAAFSLFGFIPFILMITIALWPHTYHVKKKLLWSIMVLLLLIPFDCRIQEALNSALASNGPIGLFNRSVSEGWSAPLELSIQQGLIHDNANTLMHLAAASISLKKNDKSEALRQIERVIQATPDDPVAQISAANIYWDAGKVDIARGLLEQCTQTSPRYEAAHFNLGQLLIAQLQPALASNFLEASSRINKDRIAEFVEKNERYFSDAWPRLRQFMQPNYRPVEFWSTVFPRNNGDWQGAQVLFKDSFFGISIMTFYIIMICILLALSFKYKGLHRTEKIFHCKYCGAPMCHTCRKGIICQTCHALLAKVSNQELSKSIATKIIASKHSRDRILGLCVEALIPGGGHLLWSDKTLPPRVILLPCSTIVVGTYYFFTRIVTSSPSFVIRPYMNMVLAVCILYNVLFCWIALKKIMNNRTTSKSR